MGSTLTNTQPKDTYKSLLKTSDSTELSATAKYVSDGNGNDSALALSTSAVGIGTSSPIGNLNVNGGTGDTTANDTVLTLNRTSSTSNVLAAKIVLTAPSTYQQNLNFRLKTTASSAEDPSYYTDIMRVTADGLCFGSDTAAANALDDYEEGTWTPVFYGDITAGSYTYATSISGGGYRKIGSQVTVWCSLIDVSQSVAGSGQMVVSGLPFNTANDYVFSRLSCPLYVRQSLSTRNNLIAIVPQNNNKVYLQYDNNGASGGSPMTIAGDYASGMDLGFSLTYFV